MVDVVPANDKLRSRVRLIVSEATGAAPETVDAALAESDGDAKVAIVSILMGIDADDARTRLAAASGNLRHALVP
jgi:N-acetylmuramic acid 6-phosphate etherase